MTKFTPTPDNPAAAIADNRIRDDKFRTDHDAYLTSNLDQAKGILSDLVAERDAIAAKKAAIQQSLADYRDEAAVFNEKLKTAHSPASEAAQFLPADDRSQPTGSAYRYSERFGVDSSGSMFIGKIDVQPINSDNEINEVLLRHQGALPA